MDSEPEKQARVLIADDTLSQAEMLRKNLVDEGDPTDSRHRQRRADRGIDRA